MGFGLGWRRSESVTGDDYTKHPRMEFSSGGVGYSKKDGKGWGREGEGVIGDGDESGVVGGVRRGGGEGAYRDMGTRWYISVLNYPFKNTCFYTVYNILYVNSKTKPTLSMNKTSPNKTISISDSVPPMRLPIVVYKARFFLHRKLCIPTKDSPQDHSQRSLPIFLHASEIHRRQARPIVRDDGREDKVPEPLVHDPGCWTGGVSVLAVVPQPSCGLFEGELLQGPPYGADEGRPLDVGCFFGTCVPAGSGFDLPDPSECQGLECRAVAGQVRQ